MKTLHTLLATALLAATAGAGATEFRSADTHNADDYPTVAAVKHMSELLEKKSGGKHKIKVFNKQALGSEKETIDQVKIGALDFTRVNVGPMNAICPLTQVPTMPFLFRSIEHMRKSLDGPVGEEILKSCESAGFIGLAFYDSGARSIYAKKPIKTVADAKGLKIRVQQSDLWVALVSAMGANATPMPYGEVYTGLKTGLIDAAENNIPSRSIPPSTSRRPRSTREDRALDGAGDPGDVQDRLGQAAQGRAGHDPQAAAKESVAFQRQKWDEQEAKSLANVKAAGAEIIEVDKSSFQAVMGPVYDKFMSHDRDEAPWSRRCRTPT